MECAGLSDSVKVYAIEKNPEAVELLYENCKKFALTNVKIIAGTAPEALEDLPAPTHVFIGGSSGKMEGMRVFVAPQNTETRPTAAENPAGRPSSGPNAQPKVAPM